MKKLLFAAALLVSTTAFAAEEAETIKVDPKVDRLVRDSLPVCPDAKVTYSELGHPVPSGMKAAIVRVESKRPSCEAQLLAVTSAGGFYLGYPWFLDEQKGTIEEKLKQFAWEKLQQNVTVSVDRNRTRDGLFKATLYQAIEGGKLPIEGEVDPAGTTFFLGHFRPDNSDARATRLKAFEPFVATSPATGAEKPVVTVIEFSDFECPSCQHAAGYMKPILEKHGDKVRYVRYDLPLVMMHPWALAASLGGRAIQKQKPELFWDYKKQLYENQDKMNAFTIGDFARGFAQEHQLDLKQYDADVASEELKNSIIKGVGTAFANDIRATPTYLVNGVVVDAGTEGKDLAAYVESQLK